VPAPTVVQQLNMKVAALSAAPAVFLGVVKSRAQSGKRIARNGYGAKDVRYGM
jgi:hypothetical protein